MVEQASMRTLSSYVPALVLRRLAVDAPALTPPSAERYPGALLFADIVDFTRNAERMSRELGPEAGAERLALMLNDFVGRFIDIVTAYGGEVVKFAGDALVTMWPARQSPGPAFGAERELAQATRRAAACALHLQQSLHNHQSPAGPRLAMQIGIGAGFISAVHLGGVLGRVEFLLSGSPLLQMSRAQSLAAPGQVVLSPEAWELVSDVATGRQLADGFRQLVALDNPPPRSPAPSPEWPEAMRPFLQPYIPAAVYSRLAAGHERWEAELRQVTILFIHLPSYGTSIKHPYQRTLPQAQAVMQALQQALYRHEGSINKLNVDNKGITLVAAMGLPPLAHQDDPLRGVLAARDMQTALRELGRPSAIGVATGLVFCGPVGNDIRREYTMVGDAANLASRLMEAVADVDRRDRFAIHCDQATYQATRDRIAYERLPAVTLKGKEQPVPLYRPRLESGSRAIAAPSMAASQRIEGRQDALELVDRRLNKLRRRPVNAALVDDGRTTKPAGRRIILIEGEGGIGKSRLLAEIARRAQTLRLYTLSGGGRAGIRNQPFSVWQEPFTALFGLSSAHTDARVNWQTRILSQLPATHLERGFPALALRYAPLLNTVLPLEIPENDFTAGLDASRRIAATHHFLLRMLQLMLERPGQQRRLPAVFLFDDLHHFDLESLRLLLAAAERIRPARFIIATQPVAAETPFATRTAVYHQLMAVKPRDHIRLDALSEEETINMVRRQLGARRLDASVAELILRHGQGNPFFSLKLAGELLERGMIVTQGGECFPASDNSLPAYLTPPQAVRSVVISALDGLAPASQLLLKTASVLPEPFSVDQIYAAHPLPTSRQRIEARLSELIGLGLLAVESEIGSPHPLYCFGNDCVRRTLAGLLLQQQKEQIQGAMQRERLTEPLGSVVEQVLE